MSIFSQSDAPGLPPNYTLEEDEQSPDFLLSTVHNETSLNEGDSERLPDYAPPVPRASSTNAATSGTRRAERFPPKEFIYSIKSHGKDIVTLTLYANASYSNDAATFLGREPVAGNVRLRLDKPTTVKAITVTIFGRCLPTVGFYVDTNSFSDETTFMKISHTLWSSGQDSRGLDMISGGTTRDGKLQGEYLWSFAIDVPPTLAGPTPDGDVHFVPPQTFKEQYCAMVVYDILLRVKRSWPSPDHRIEAPFQYIPAIFPGDFPQLRRLAYETGTPLFGPDIDPEGWHALDMSQLTGTLFKTRPLDIECTLFLAKPLEYARGTEIPLYMRFASPSAQAVDLMSAACATAIKVRLLRRITLNAQTSRGKLSSAALAAGQRMQERRGATAVWWPPTSVIAPAAEGALHEGKHVRYVRGELRLKDGLKPSSGMPYMRIEYCVLLLPFSSVTGIELDIENDKIHQEQLVEIGTLFGRGPVPRRHTATP